MRRLSLYSKLTIVYWAIVDRHGRRRDPELLAHLRKLRRIALSNPNKARGIMRRMVAEGKQRRTAVTT